MEEDKISVDEAMESLEEEQAEEEKAELSKEEFEANLKKLEEKAIADMEAEKADEAISDSNATAPEGTIPTGGFVPSSDEQEQVASGESVVPIVEEPTVSTEIVDKKELDDLIISIGYDPETVPAETKAQCVEYLTNKK